MIQIAQEETAEGRGQQERLRRRLLESALAYYQEFIELKRDQPVAQADLESTRNRVQAILADLTLMRDAYRHVLLGDRAVQDDLKLSPEARTSLAEALGDIPLFQSGSPPHRDPPPVSSDGGSRQMLRNMRVHETAITKILSTAQLARLQQIALQVRGAEAFQEPEVVTALNLSREQRTQLRAICGPRPGHHHGPPHDFDSGPMSASKNDSPGNREFDRDEPPGRHGPGRHHEAELQKALALLNSDQLAHWRELTGPQFAGLSDSLRLRGHHGPHDDGQRLD